MSGGYEYDNESEGMREALEKARDEAHGGVIDLDAMMDKLTKSWGGGEEPPASPPEEQPSKQTGDAAPSQGEEMKAEAPPEEPWARMKFEMRQNETRPPPPSPLAEKMASVGWTPKETPWSPGWAELHAKLSEDGSAKPAVAPPAAPPAAADPEALLKQVAEQDAAKKAETEKAAQEQAAQQAAQPPPAPPPEEALLQQHGELEAQKASQAAAEKKAAEEQAAKAAEQAKKNAPPPTDWDAMLKQLQEAEHSRDTMGDVGAMLHAAAPGFQAPANAGEGAVAGARAAMELEQKKREDEARQHKASADLLEQTKKAALTDPKSPESQRARDAFTAQFPEAAKVMRLEGLSANEIAGLSQREVQLEHYRASDAAEKAKAAEKEAEAKAKQAEKEAGDRAKQAEKDKNEKAMQASLVDERSAILSDPRFKGTGAAPESLDALDRHGLDAFRRDHLDKVKPAKPGAGHNVGVKIEPGKIETVPERRPGYRDMVQGIADGRLQAPQPGTRFGAEVISDVLGFKPTFDATRFGNYAAVAKHQATGPDVLAIDVARQHMKTARDSIPQNADLAWVNRAKQAMAAGSGSAEYKPFIVASTAVAHELARVYGINDQAGKEEMEKMLSSVQSPEQLRSAFDTFDELIVGKQEGLKRQMEKVAPKGGESAGPPAGAATTKVRLVGQKAVVPVESEKAKRLLGMKNADGSPKYEEIP